MRKAARGSNDDKSGVTRPIQYLIAVGKLVQNTTVIESFMANALKHLLKCRKKTADAIFYTHDSFQSKASLLRRVVVANGEAADKEFVERIISAATKANNQRRQIAHSMQLSKNPDEGSEFVIYSPKSAQRHPATIGLLKQLVDQSYQAGLEAGQAYKELFRKHTEHGPPETG
jgi:hypothetical protein